jgi:hypothetical protein
MVSEPLEDLRICQAAFMLPVIVAAADYQPRFVPDNLRANCIRESFPALLAEIVAGLETAGSTVVCDPVTHLLFVNEEFTASLVLARSFETQAGALRWQIRFDAGLAPDVTVAVRLDRSNQRPLDYYILLSSEEAGTFTISAVPTDHPRWSRVGRYNLRRSPRLP